jgi:hypothetical protein
MEPEIARRCSACGASVRGGAFFCPQCGKPLKAGAPGVVSSAAETPELPARLSTDAGLNASTVGLPESAPRPPAPGIAPAPDNFARSAGEENYLPGATLPQREAEDGNAASKRQRVTAAARDVVEEKLSPRVEKLRQASNVMLEEASYDPSLRFVLVAVAFLVLSLFLLLLNYLVG